VLLLLQKEKLQAKHSPKPSFPDREALRKFNRHKLHLLLLRSNDASTLHRVHGSIDVLNSNGQIANHLFLQGVS